MPALKESYSAPVEADLLLLFWEVFYMPIVAAAKVQSIRTNAAEAYIIAAIKSGKIKYADGKFSGDFDVRTSRELSSFASFNRRTKVWTGNPSPAIKAASILADTHRRELQARLEKAIDAAEANIKQTVQSLSFGSDLPLFDMAEDIKKDLYSVGVMPEIDARTEKTLREQYTNNMRLNIVDEADSSKGWAPEQINRLRDMVKEYQTTGTNDSLRALIEREWDTSRAKAKFLATQETRLFLDTLSRDRARRTGVRRYRWSTSHDEKVRQSHKLLDGKIVDIDGPGEIVDLKTGRRAHAGQDFGCRCNKIWVLE